MIAGVLQDWQSSEGALVPVQCVMDVLANAYNDNSPAALPVAQQLLLPLVQDSRLGPALGLDAFLQVLVTECLQGDAGRALLQCIFGAWQGPQKDVLHSLPLVRAQACIKFLLQVSYQPSHA